MEQQWAHHTMMKHIETFINMEPFFQELDFLFESKSQNASSKIFVMRTAVCPKDQKWDRIGFVLDNGKLKDMPEVSYDKMDIQYPIKKSEHTHLIKKSRISIVKQSMDVKYEEFELKNPVVVMDKFYHHKPKTCASYVMAVMNRNRNIAGKKMLEPNSYSIDDIYSEIKKFS